jgi:hypothetical protein
MAEGDRDVQATVADMAAVIERSAADLALAEEPAGFLAMLDEQAADE